MILPAILLFIYALLLIIGGLIGFWKVASLVSLIMGFISGILALIFAVGVKRKCNYSYVSGIVLSGALSAFFIYRFFTTLGFFPAGLMACVSLVVLAVLMLLKNKS